MQIDSLSRQKIISLTFSARAAHFPAGTLSCKLLDRFVPQENPGQETRIIVERSCLSKLGRELEEFLNYNSEKNPNKRRGISEMHNILAAVLACQHFSKKDVSDFFRLLPCYQYNENFGYRAGLFLSALFNSSEHNNFKITLPCMDEPINSLCMFNTKNIEFFGNVGDSFGAYAKGGFLLLHGNADSHTGDGNDGGTIVVDGNCGRWTGEDMKSGEIHVTKDTEGITGNRLHGGTIRVNGDLAIDRDFLYGGNIFKGDTQVVKDGRRIYSNDK